MIYFAPLQSYTTLPYYIAFNALVGGVDKYFTPFYRKSKSGFFEFEKELIYRRDINIIPQVLVNSADDLIEFAQYMLDKGFEEINLNMGCPFPMVVNRHLGSGLLPYVREVDKMLTDYFNKQLPVRLSIKTRLGWENTSEIIAMVKVLNTFPIHESILHPRLGTQKYTGSPNWDCFSQLLSAAAMDVVGNGDIMFESELRTKEIQFAKAKGWMIGRGLLANPFMLANVEDDMSELHELFYENLRQFGYMEGQILNHLKCFWEYPLQQIEGGVRLHRKIRKTGKLADYEKIVLGKLVNR